MSIESMAIVLNHSKSTGTAKVVILGIASHDGDGGAWPSVATLARYANVEVRNVQRAIKRLEQLGEIRVFVQDGGTARTPDHSRPNRYQITLRCPHTCDGTSQHRTQRTLAGMDINPLAETSPPGGNVTPPVAETSPEPSINHPSMETSSSSDKYQPAREAESVSNEEEKVNRKPRKVTPRPESEQELVYHFQSIDCPNGNGLKHWIPPGLTVCARSCGLDLAEQPELEQAS